MNEVRAERANPGQRIIEALIAEHVRFHYDLLPIDDQTWAIHGYISVDGEVILAEFTTQNDARSAPAQVAATRRPRGRCRA